MNRTEEQWVQYASDLMVELEIVRSELFLMTHQRDRWQECAQAQHQTWSSRCGWDCGCLIINENAYDHE